MTPRWIWPCCLLAALLAHPGRADEGPHAFDALDFAALNVLANRGDAAAQAEMAQRYLDGNGQIRDERLAEQYFLMAADQGNALAQYQLGLMRFDAGNVSNNNPLFFQTEKGRLSRQELAEAARLFRLAARQGHPEASYRLGIMLLQGTGVPADPADARTWLEQAARAHQRDALFVTGLMLETGEGLPQDAAAAQARYREAAAAGHAGAAFNLALMCEEGRGSAASPAEAATFYRMAADGGIDDARYRLAGLQAAAHKDTGVRALLLPAARHGHIGAMALLGQWMAEGRDGPRDVQGALPWLRQAADQSHAGALDTLGRLYESGALPPASRVIAHAFYQLATEIDPAPDNPAIADLARTTASLSPAARAHADGITRGIIQNGAQKAIDFLGNRTADAD